MSEGKVLTENALANMQPNAMVSRGYARCVEDCITPGIYLLTPEVTTTTEPTFASNWNYGWMQVLNRGGDIFQEIIHVEGEKRASRVRRKGIWKPWRMIQSTPIETK